jgi:THO complex subunit 2
LQSNPGISYQLWTLIELWPYTTRYALYGEWKHSTYKSIPELKIPLTGCEKDCRYILARLSKQTVKQYGRHIGKVVHSNPTLAFSKIIKQLESYDNMVSHVVDATSYLTNFELDVMIYCLLEALGDSKKPRVEDNGQSISSWLKSLSSFTGSLLKKHSVDLSGLLQYLAAQLGQNNVYDLVILQELVGSMTGIKAMEDVTAKQLDFLAGDRLLRRIGLLFEPVNVTKKSTERLVHELLKSNLTLELGILIAQKCEKTAISDQSAELKISAWLNDHCLKSFLQYFEFVTSQLDDQVYADLAPSIYELLNVYKLSAPFAFHILRPKINSLAAKANDIEQRKCAIRDLVNQVEESFEKTMFEKLNPNLFTNFWIFSLSDLTVPSQLYHEQIGKIQSSIAEVETRKDYSEGKKEKENFEISKLKLSQECQNQQNNFAAVQACLLETSLNYFGIYL